MNEKARVQPVRERVEMDEDGSSVATHRRGERMRTYSFRPRGEARM